MAVYLSPGVYPREIDLSVVPTAVGALTPVFIGTAKRGPVQDPTFISNSQQYIDTFGNPFPESYLGYAVIAYFEQGNRAWVLRVGVECEDGQPDALADICIDTSGQRGHGWGRVAVFSGIDFGKICTRAINADAPLEFHNALTSNISYNQVSIPAGHGPTTATLSFTSLNSYTGAQDDSYTVLITSDVSASSGSTIDGATYEVIRNSDGYIVKIGTIVESGVPGTSDPINIGDGLIFTVVVTGVEPIRINDTFTFVVRPNNRTFSFNVDRQTTAESAVTTPVVEYTIVTIGDATVSYTSAEDFADAINALVPSSEPYRAINIDADETVCFETDVAGRSIQIVSREAFALEVGVALYAFDVPRSHVMSTEAGPYDITNDNNRISVKIVGLTDTTEIQFSVPVGLSTPAATLAASLNLGGVYSGQRYFRSYSMLVPGGEEQVFIETSLAHQFDQFYLQADSSHYKTLRFAEQLVILYPYTSAYQTYSDSRVVLPEPGVDTANVPRSCELDPFSADCALDSAYYQNVVGWLVATTAGTWIDDYRITLQIASQENGPNGNNVAGIYDLLVEDSLGNVLSRVESVTFDPTSDDYIGNKINPDTTIGGANGNEYVNWIPRPSFLNNDPINDPANFEVRLPGSIFHRTFVGSANGIPLDPAYSSELDRSVIGNPALETGIFAFANPEVYDITLLIIPGASSGAVIGQGLQMCERRGDMMMIIDPPFGLRAQQVVDWHNGILYSDLAQAINSSYGALYHPWLKIYDQFNGDYIFIPPSGHVSQVYAKTEQTTEQWFAPAGLTRGKLLTPIDTEVDLTQGERDLLYGYGNAVNPIVNFPQDGIVVWGQRTLQRKQSALDRVNVRMLLIFIKKNATRFLRTFVFEPNDRITRAQVTTISNTFLADIQARRGLYAFNVVCDERNNTPERIDRNELHVAYFLKPVRAAEFIVLNLVVLRTGASFGADEILAAGGVVTNQAAV